MRLVDVVETSTTVAATRSRNAKRDAMAELLAGHEPDDVEIAVAMLTGEVRQGRVGVGWASIRDLDQPSADAPSLTVGDVDAAIDRIVATTGPGSMGARHDLLAELWGRSTEPEQDFLARLLIGELRQGALAGVMADAVAKAADVPMNVVRRAAMLSGDLPATARLALTEGRAALEAVGLSVGTAVEPMLAATSESVTTAIDELGTASVEWKLDGARVQVHRNGDEVRVFTRNLNDVTDRSPEAVAVVRSLDCEQVVLDGEAVGLDADGRPRAFQDTMARFGADEVEATTIDLTAVFFDVLHVDGVDLIDEPFDERRQLLADLLHERHLIPAVRTDDPEEGETFFSDAVDAGHEGVMVKDVTAPYAAGRRGKAWRKVKPVHTYDLVVLGAEWGHGRRTGWLSNLHLGARDGDDFVMVGKTFKGLTDELLTWQTERLQDLAVDDRDHTVFVRPELVVEIALDGVQRSTRYPGGIALRFARVKRYREDKQPSAADTLEALRRLLV